MMSKVVAMRTDTRSDWHSTTSTVSSEELSSRHWGSLRKSGFRIGSEAANMCCRAKMREAILVDVVAPEGRCCRLSMPSSAEEGGEEATMGREDACVLTEALAGLWWTAGGGGWATGGDRGGGGQGWKLGEP